MPSVTVEGYVYPPPQQNIFLADLVSSVQAMAIGLVLFGETIFRILSLPTPPWFRDIQENKLMTAALVWLVGNFVYGKLTTTGAFEIAFEGVTVWSKLDTNAMPPSFMFLMDAIEQIKSNSAITN